MGGSSNYLISVAAIGLSMQPATDEPWKPIGGDI